MHRTLTLLGAGALLAASMVVAPGASAASTLKDAAAARGKVFGALAGQNHMSDPPFPVTLDREFGQLTPENEMKWDATEPARNTFNFVQADLLVSHAEQQGMKVTGHTLVWHSQAPAWLQGLGTASALMEAMRNHIAVVAGHFRGKIDYWHVVNEAFDETGAPRNSVFQRTIGSGYLEAAFRAAHEADPGAQLCYNDFNIETANAKSNAVYNLVRDFKARGVPIDCVGFQSHLAVGQFPAGFQQNLRRFTDLGVDVHITELDVRVPMPPTSASLRAQANDFASAVNACLPVLRCNVITVGGVTDKFSFIGSTFPGQGAPLLFDNNYNKKPAYFAVLSALGGDPDPQPPTGPSGPSGPTGPAGVSCTFVQDQGWSTGFNGRVIVTAAGPVTSWTAQLTLGSDQRDVSVWNGTPTWDPTGTVVTVRPNGNGNLAAGQSTSFGFTLQAPNGNVAAPSLTCRTP